MNETLEKVGSNSAPPMSSALPFTEDSESLALFEVGGLRLHGVVHSGVGTESTGIVILPGWSGTRTGPHGILTAAARECARQGFPCLRFDYRGRGDSEGEVSGAHLETMAEDAIAAARYLQKNRGVTRIVLLGICAGAQVAMAAAPRVNQLAGLALWSPPPFHPDLPDRASRAHQPDSRARSRQFKILTSYTRKLLDRRTWIKLAAGKLQPRLILKIIAGRRVAPVPPPTAASNLAVSPSATGVLSSPRPDERIYEEALPGLQAPMLFIFGTADPEAEESEAYYQQALAHSGHLFTIHRIEGANHNFGSLAWKTEVIGRTVEWIKRLGGESST